MNGAKLKLYVRVLLRRRCYITTVLLPFPPISSSPLSSLIYLPSFVYIILCEVRTSARTRDVSRAFQIPNAGRTIVSLSRFPPARSYTTACIYTSYIITPDGASTSRTLGKAPHDSVYLLNTEYNVSPAYTYT